MQSSAQSTGNVITFGVAGQQKKFFSRAFFLGVRRKSNHSLKLHDEIFFLQKSANHDDDSMFGRMLFL